MTATVYFLKCPISNKLRYIGCTIQNLETRLNAHMANQRYESTIEKLYWINELKKQGLKAIITPIETVPTSEARKCEKKWIRFFKERSIRLLQKSNFRYSK